MALKYVPAEIPDDPKELPEFVSRELSRIADAIASDLDILYVAPKKPRVGMIRYADGTKWNPGSGEGVYRFGSDLAWHYLG